MPGGDRTGPGNRGPRTGRALGYCSGFNAPGYANPTYGQGFGRGRGRGFGRGFWRRGRGFGRRNYYPYPYDEPDPYFRGVYPQPSKDEEKTYLEDLVKDLEEELQTVKKRLQELVKEKNE